MIHSLFSELTQFLNEENLFSSKLIQVHVKVNPRSGHSQDYRVGPPWGAAAEAADRRRKTQIILHIRFQLDCGVELQRESRRERETEEEQEGAAGSNWDTCPGKEEAQKSPSSALFSIKGKHCLQLEPKCKIWKGKQSDV